jgi:electron transfer flavoprotein beta subunit
LEAAVALAEKVEAKVTVVSVGGTDADDSKTKKSILSRGADELVVMVDKRLKDADSHVTAHALKATIESLEAYDLVICGDGSADRYAQQVGIQLGQLLDIPTLNAASALEVSGSELVITRTLESQTEVLSTSLPALVCVTSDLNQPRIATMKQILAAGKKPSMFLDSQLVPDIAAVSEKFEVLAPQEADRKRDIIEGDSDEQIASFVAKVKETVG